MNLYYQQYKIHDKTAKLVGKITNYKKLLFCCTVIYPIGYERVYLPLYKVADTPFHIQGDRMS